MHPTITENGALYAIQRGTLQQSYETLRKRRIVKRIVRPSCRAPQIQTGHKRKTQEVCFI